VRRLSLAGEIFAAMAASAVFVAVILALVAYRLMHGVVHAVLLALPNTDGLSETLLLANAERSFLSGISIATYALVFFAVVVASIAGVIVSLRMSRPAKQLMQVADDFSRGDREVRAAVRGPVEIAALSSSFNNLADVLDEEDHLRRKLVADIAHELRNPITVAMAQTEAMLSGVLQADRAHLSTLLEDLQHLEALMDDMQESAIAESGRWRYQMERIDLAALVVRNVERTAQRVGPGTEVHVVGAGEPLMVTGDELRLSQVMRNILSNARRHTTSGSITVYVDAAEDKVTVGVVDTGEGISPEDLPHIFDRFFRADAARTIDAGGAGLGLSIARAIVRDHGGEVFAESELGHGALVGFTLPRLR
jgi:two-component system, OmpR family, sensor histidine kinase BaeS